MAQKVTIDGSFGEGGGQILRTSLALSALTGRELEISNVRAGRAKPGLRPQHLQGVRAAAEICSAQVAGATLGSQKIDFRPGAVRGGGYRFEIGTAGSTSLVLQTVYLPLALTAGETSTIAICGGTHVPMAPCFHYLDMQWRHFMERIGLRVSLAMKSAGYYPRGGGEITAEIHPSSYQQAQLQHSALQQAAPYLSGKLLPVVIDDRGKLLAIRGVSSVTGLPMSIAERQKHQALIRLAGVGCPVAIEMVDVPGVGQGTMLLLLAVFENSQACYCALGARGKRAEAVADEAADALLELIRGRGAVDEHLADQLILPLSLAGGASSFVTPKVTTHLLTNIEVIKHFLPVEFDVKGEVGREGRVVVRPGL